MYVLTITHHFNINHDFKFLYLQSSSLSSDFTFNNNPTHAHITTAIMCSIEIGDCDMYELKRKTRQFARKRKLIHKQTKGSNRWEKDKKICKFEEIFSIELSFIVVGKKKKKKSL